LADAAGAAAVRTATTNTKKATMRIAWALLAIGGLNAIAPENRVQTFYYENVLGTSLEIRVATSGRLASTEAPAAARDAALAEIDRLAGILSGYDASSEFSRWARTRHTPVRVSPELFEVLRLWDHWRAATHGALEPAAETATRLWTRGVPTAAERAEAVRQMSAAHWTLDAARRTATRLDNAPLRLNSFTKIWIAQRALAAAQPHATGILLNLGGDIVSAGHLDTQVAVADPRHPAENAEPLLTITSDGRAVATSGPYRRGFTHNGVHYSHIIDPRTALPVEHAASATVASKDAAEAGALATAFNVLTPEEIQRLAARHPQASYAVLLADGRRLASADWAGRFAAQATKPSASATNSTTASATLQFELARVEGGRYRRPYVAVWIEDKDHFPVRTVALWYERPRWLPDLKAWSRADRLRSLAEGTELAATLATATRPAGKYSVQWDGKDQQGKAVKPGKYTLYLEVAREHGTYQLLHQDLDTATPAARYTLAPNTEVAAAAVEWKR